MARVLNLPFGWLKVYNKNKNFRNLQFQEESKLKISTRGRYALRLMLDLALHHTGTPVRIKEISARQEISDKYLEQIISVLVRAGYVKSVRGPQGGYRLAKPAEAYSAGMILRLVEGSLSPVPCLGENDHFCGRQGDCATWLLWKEIDEAVQRIVDHVTLADLVDWQRALSCRNT